MSFGDHPRDEDLRQAWAAFCDKLKAAGDVVFKDSNPAHEIHRVDGFRYLAQNLGQAFDLALETKDPKFPSLHRFCSPTRKLGSDNADCIYIQAWIDGRSVYRISGKKGSARFWNVAIQGPRSADAYGSAAKRMLHEPFGDSPEVNLFGQDLKTNWDGSFELYIGGEKQGQNWLPTTAGTRKLFLRQYFDRWDEEAADYRIERLGTAESRPMPVASDMIEAMNWAGNFVYDCVDFWPDWTWETGDQIDANALNQFRGPNIADQKPWSASAEEKDDRRGRLVTMARWALNADEALILEFDRYDGFWMITSEGIFGNSMDFLYRPVSYTPSRTAIDPDGKIRLVLTQQDPGFSNWIDNQGFVSGVLNFRNVMTRHVPQLSTKTVKLSELAQNMHPQSRRVTKEERAAQLRERFSAMQRRYRL